MGGWRRFSRSVGHAKDGIIYTIRTQKNMRIHVGAAITALIISWVLDIVWGHVLLVLFSIAFIFILEMINTAIEATVDLVIKEYHPLAKVAKDVAAGSVLVGSIMVSLIGLYVFAPPLLKIFKEVL